MNTLRILAIIQARISSTRLPGKIILDIGGQPMLVRVAERTRRAKTISKVVIATTKDSSDDIVEELCAKHGYLFYRGSQYDVLDRYYQAARQFNADVIVRVTGDCPMIDPQIIDETVTAFLGNNGMQIQKTSAFPWDLATNRLPPPCHRTYPIGLDTEVCTFQALERAWKEANQPYQREHVMPYLYDPERAVIFRLSDIGKNKSVPSSFFRVLCLEHDPDYGSYRWTVDTPEDLELARQIYAHFSNRDDFTWHDILDLFQQKPELAAINSRVLHKGAKDIDPRSAL